MLDGAGPGAAMILAATRGPSAALYGEPLAAFGATTGQDFPAVLGAHPFAETVGLLAVAVIGLEGAFQKSLLGRSGRKGPAVGIRAAGGPPGYGPSCMNEGARSSMEPAAAPGNAPAVGGSGRAGGRSP